MLAPGCNICSLQCTSVLQKIKRYLLIFVLVMVAVAGLVVLGKAVYQISDWMNEMEEERARQRLLRAGRL